MLKKSLIYHISIVLLLLAIFFLLNAQTNITGAVIGTNFDPVKDAGVGFALLFISIVLFITEASSLEKKLDFKGIKKKVDEVQNINATQDYVYDKIGYEIRTSTKGKQGWLDIHKLDTDEGKDNAYKAAMKVATEDNPFYKKLEGISKEHSQYIGLRSIGLNPLQLKQNIHGLGKNIVDRLDSLKKSETAQNLKDQLENLPFADVKEEHIDDIVKYTIPKDIKLDKKPKTIQEAVNLLNEYYKIGGKFGEGQLKQAKYLK